MHVLPWRVSCIPLLLLHLALPPSSESLPKVQCESSHVPVLGGTISLTCEFSSDLDVLQVTWQIDKENQPQTIATYSKKYGMKISSSNDKFRSNNCKDANRSSIAISNLREEDAACYICIFNAFPHGAYKGKYCLNFTQAPSVQTAPDMPTAFPLIGANKQRKANYITVTAAKPHQEVACYSNSRNMFNIVLKHPENIQELNEEQTSNNLDGKQIYKRKFIYQDLGVTPSCVFQLQKTNVRKRSLTGEEADDIIFAHCSVTGKAPKIFWRNEGNPVNKTEHECQHGDNVTIISSRVYLRSTLSEKVEITCDITCNGCKGDLYGMKEFDRFLYIRLLIKLSSVIVVLLACSLVMYSSLKNENDAVLKQPLKQLGEESAVPRYPDPIQHMESAYQDTVHQTPDGTIYKGRPNTRTPGTSISKRKPRDSHVKENPNLSRSLFRNENHDVRGEP